MVEVVVGGVLVRRVVPVMVALVVAVVAASGVWAAHRARTARVSVSSHGTQSTTGFSYGSSSPSISGDGRFVAFESDANNLVSGDSNGHGDVFVRDRKTHRTARLSVSSHGTQGNDGSSSPSISANGRFVAFASDASNLVGGDSNGYSDVFVRDRKTHRTVRVSVSSHGTQGNIDSGSPSISANGRFVVFESDDSNLVGGDRNDARDVFVHDLKTHRTARITVSSHGSEGNFGSGAPSISADGRFVAFSSLANNLIGDGSNDPFGGVFVRDRKTHRTILVSVSSHGTQGNGYSDAPSISANGRFVAFTSDASNLVGGDSNGHGDVFVRDRRTGRTARLSLSTHGTQGNGGSSAASISGDGRFVAFASLASNLVGGDTNDRPDVFVRDRKTGRTARLSVSSDGTQGNLNSASPSISGDGRSVAFASDASNLVGGDSNDSADIFVRGPLR
jgi:Tol biopolymer transport system component